MDLTEDTTKTLEGGVIESTAPSAVQSPRPQEFEKQNSESPAGKMGPFPKNNVDEHSALKDSNDLEDDEDHSSDQLPDSSSDQQATASSEQQGNNTGNSPEPILHNNKAMEDAPPSLNSKSIQGATDVKQSPSKTGAIGKDLVALKREIGLFSGVTIILGNIIGSGIFLTPTKVYTNAGSIGLSMVIWAVSGIFSLIGALCFAELGTTMDSSGAEYTYIKESFGGLPAFMVLWVNLIIIIPTGHIIVALTFAFYIVEPFYPDRDCPPPDLFVRIVAVLVQGE